MSSFFKQTGRNKRQISIHVFGSSVYSPPFIQQVGHHAHEGFGFDLATLLQLIQVQSEFKPLGSAKKGIENKKSLDHRSVLIQHQKLVQ